MKRKYMLFSLLGVLMVQFGFAQQKTITGNITDETGNALPGATILIENTQRGVTSDFDGNYSVEASENEVLIFSYVGYTDKKIKIDTSNNYNVNLNLDNKLDEVVVTSLGIKRDKKSLGFSQQTVKGASLTQAKETDISNALAGKISGVQIIGNTSSAFGNSSIKLRGNPNVLYVVDGIRYQCLHRCTYICNPGRYRL